MLVRVKIDQVQTLRDLEVETYRDTFGPYIVEKDLEDYFSTVLSLEQIEKDLRDPESETYFVLNEEQEICGFLKINWGQAQTEPVEMDKSFDGSMSKRNIMELVSVRKCLPLRCIKRRAVALSGPG